MALRSIAQRAKQESTDRVIEHLNAELVDAKAGEEVNLCRQRLTDRCTSICAETGRYSLDVICAFSSCEYWTYVFLQTLGGVEGRHPTLKLRAITLGASCHGVSSARR